MYAFPHTYFPTTFQVKLSNSSEEDFVNRLLQLERHHVKTRQMEYEEKRRARQEAAMEAAKSAEIQIDKMMPKWWTLGDLQVTLDKKYTTVEFH